MKKIITFVLIVLCLTGCARVEKNITPTNTITTTPTGTVGYTPTGTVGYTPSPTEELTEDDIIITIPGSFFEFREIKNLLDSEISRGNIKRHTENTDGSITYALTQQQYDTILANLKTSIIETFNLLEQNSTSIKKIEYNEEFTEITFTVVKKEFENSADEIASYIASAESMVYSFIKSNNVTFPVISIHIKDESTGEVIRSIKYPNETK